MPDLGKAYVQIVPSAEGIQGSITKLIGGEAESAGSSAGKSMLGSMSKAITTGAVVGGIASIGKALFDGIKTIVTEYANYEQLVGGVETLFKGSADVVKGYAENAYKTAGLSANEYMETVTSFSASLLQSLGGDTAKAAKVADMAITDMSDNANKMGTSMESIQNAYQGFAKQNYTMLDNLKLGYGGTKEEMQRLLTEAEKIKRAHGEIATYSINSYADIVEAIHVVQTEMGITGTTAKEAEGTITGSLNAVKAAWKNLLAGMGNKNADIDKLVGNLVSTVEIALDNLMPVIDTALQGIGTVIDKLSPIVAEHLPGFIDTVSPMFVDAATQIATAVILHLPEIAYGVADGLNDVMIGLGSMSLAVTKEIVEGIEPAEEEITKYAVKLGDVQDELGVGAVTSEKFAVKQLDVAANTQDASDAIDEEAEAAKAAHDAIIDVASAAIEARYSGGDLREEYNNLSKELDKLRDSGEEYDIQLAEQKLYLLDVAATNQELATSYSGLVDAAGVSLTSLSQWLIENEMTADEWASAVNSNIDGVINGFSELDTSLDMSLEEMAANLSENIQAYANWNTNIQTLMDAAVETGNQSAIDFVNYMQQMGIGAADQVQMMVDNIDYTMDTFPDLMSDASYQGMLELYNGIEGQKQNVGDAATEVRDTVVDNLEASAGSQTKGQEAASAYASAVQNKDAAPAGKALANSSIAGIKAQYAAMKTASKAMAQGAVDMIKTVAPLFQQAGVLLATNLQRGLQSQLPNIRSLSTSVGSALTSSMSAGIRAGSGSVSSAAYSAAIGYSGGLSSSVRSSGYYIGYALDSGMASGIWSGSSAVTSAAYSVARSAYNSAKSALGIHSPSRVFRDEIGAMIPAGMALGIERNSQIVADAMQNLATSTTDAYRIGGVGVNDYDPYGSYGMYGGVSIAQDTSRSSMVAGQTNTRLDMMLNYLAELVDGQDKVLVLDSGELVGATVNKMDSALGRVRLRGATS